jgi:hypothetical protein
MLIQNLFSDSKIREQIKDVWAYPRGGQLFWLGGHFVEAEVGGKPNLLK